MKNKITNWSWDVPDSTGIFLMCHGDVETKENIYFLSVVEKDGELVDEQTNTPVSEISSGWKFAELVTGGQG